MKIKLFILLFFATASLHSTAFSSIVLNDGNYHLIDSFINDSYRIDYQAPSMSTHLEVATNGGMNSVYMYEDSILTVSGGDPGYIYGYDESEIAINSGGFHRIHVEDSSQVLITGYGYGSSISQYGNSNVTISGSDFEVDGQALSYGIYTTDDFTSEFDLSYIIDDTYNSFHMILADNSTLSLVPEPGSILLFALGSVFLKKRVKK